MRMAVDGLVVRGAVARVFGRSVGAEGQGFVPPRHTRVRISLLKTRRGAGRHLRRPARYVEATRHTAHWAVNKTKIYP